MASFYWDFHRHVLQTQILMSAVIMTMAFSNDFQLLRKTSRYLLYMLASGLVNCLENHVLAACFTVQSKISFPSGKHGFLLRFHFDFYGVCLLVLVWVSISSL